MNKLSLLTFMFSLYSALGVTYILATEFSDRESARIRDICEKQNIMSTLKCYKINRKIF